jgi:hypothetical protein
MSGAYELNSASSANQANSAHPEERIILKLVISSDHAGFSLKEEVRAYLAQAGHEIVDLGAYNAEP